MSNIQNTLTNISRKVTNTSETLYIQAIISTWNHEQLKVSQGNCLFMFRHVTQKVFAPILRKMTRYALFRRAGTLAQNYIHGIVVKRVTGTVIPAPTKFLHDTSRKLPKDLVLYQLIAPNVRAPRDGGGGADLFKVWSHTPNRKLSEDGSES